MTNPFHGHVWEDISTNYISPVETGDDLEKYGYTRLYQRCTSCGEIQDTMKPGHLVIRDVPETIDVPIIVHRIE